MSLKDLNNTILKNYIFSVKEWENSIFKLK